MRGQLSFGDILEGLGVDVFLDVVLHLKKREKMVQVRVKTSLLEGDLGRQYFIRDDS